MNNDITQLNDKDSDITQLNDEDSDITRLNDEDSDITQLNDEDSDITREDSYITRLSDNDSDCYITTVSYNDDANTVLQHWFWQWCIIKLQGAGYIIYTVYLRSTSITLYYTYSSMWFIYFNYYIVNIVSCVSFPVSSFLIATLVKKFDIILLWQFPVLLVKFFVIVLLFHLNRPLCAS